MEINSEIFDLFAKYSIRKKEGLTFLLSVYHDCVPDYIPEEVQRKVLSTGIVKNTTRGLDWSVPLFNEQETAFSWVSKEYCELFRSYHPKGAAMYQTEATARMKKLFRDHLGEYTKEDVLEATKTYLKTTNIGFARLPHYFISKGRGDNKIEPLKSWLETIKNNRVKKADIVPDKHKLQ